MRNFSSFFRKSAFIFLIHGVTCWAKNSASEVRVIWNSKHTLRVVFEAPYSDETKQLLLSLNSRALKQAEDILQLKLENSAELHFDSRRPYHNGLTTLVPRDRILIYTRNPESDSSLGHSQDYLYETLLHEWAHLLSSAQRSGIFSALSYLVGNLSTPNGLWPRWIHEGLAVWVESQFFGRANSGVIALDQRRLAEYTLRTGETPLSSSDLDGNSNLNEAAHAGDIPYHFGYLLWRDWLKKYPHQTLGAFAKTSSASLGLSFRSVFRQLGSNIDEDFASFRSQWIEQQTPLVSLQSSLGQELAESRNIRGPFQNSAGGSSWVEYPEHESPEINFLAGGALSTLNWKERWGRVFSVQFLKGPERTLAYVLSGTSEGKKTLRIFKNEDLLCKINLPFANEILVPEEKTLFWISEQQSGVSEVYEADIDFSRCATRQTEQLYKGLAFERMSYLRQSFDQKELFVSFSEKRNSSCERTVKVRGSNPASLIPLGNLQEVSCPQKSGKCLIGQYFSQTYVGPVLLHGTHGAHGTTAQWKMHKLPLKTGSYRFSMHSSQEILVSENLWEKEHLMLFRVEDFFNAPSETYSAACTAPPIADVDTAPALTPAPYSFLNTLFPKFWIPTANFYDGGYFFGAQVFYSDIRARYSGDTSLGYSSEIQRVLFSSSLKTPPLFSKSLFDASLIEVGLIPTRIYSIVQNRGYESYGMTLSTSKESKFSYSLLPYIQHRWGTQSLGVEAYHRGVPGVLHSLGSSAAPRNFNEPQRISSLRSGISLVNKTQWIKAWDFQTRLNVTKDLGTRAAGWLALDHAYTDKKNFPLAFYEWGGQYSFSENQGPYLNRGFQPRTALARALVRAHLSTAINIWNPAWSLSWNRFRMDSVDLRLLGESLSYNSTNPSSSYRLGKNIFSTVGAQTQFFGQTLGYVDYHFSLGVFKGFGPLSETRAEFGIGGNLDL